MKSTLIGEFKVADCDRETILQIVRDLNICEIESLVLMHINLYKPYFTDRPTASEISKRLMTICTKAAALLSSLSNLDGHSQAELATQTLRSNGPGSNLDNSALVKGIKNLAMDALSASRNVKPTAGAGTRGKGQRPTPDSYLAAKIADRLRPHGINVETDSPGSAFVKICQAISDSGGFSSNDVRGAIRVHLRAQHDNSHGNEKCPPFP